LPWRGRRYVVCFSPARHLSDNFPHAALAEDIENDLIELSEHERTGRLSDKGKIVATADRISLRLGRRTLP
jgi:hypothetical protein